MNHHSFLIKQAMLPLLAGSGLVGAGVGGLTAGFTGYKDPELAERRNRLKDVLIGALTGGITGGIGGTIGGIGGAFLGSRSTKIPENASINDTLARAGVNVLGAGLGGLAGMGLGGAAGGFAGGRLAARMGESELKRQKALEEKKG